MKRDKLMRDYVIIPLIGALLIVGSVLCAVAFADNFKGKYFEKDGCIYLTGNRTEAERQKEREHYKERMAERTIQINREIKRNHKIEIETIKAQAMRDYLIAQSMPLREVAEAIRTRKPNNQSVWIGDITSNSNSYVGDTTANGGSSTSTAYTGTITNTSAGGNATASTGTVTNTNSATGGNVGNNSNRNTNNANNTTSATNTNNNAVAGRDMLNNTITY